LLHEDVPIGPATEGEVILIVEDEPCVLEAGIQNLRELGYTTIAAPDAHSALQRLGAAERVDILFSDIVMPGGMDGFQLSVEARRLHPDIKVLLTSGYARTGMAADLPKDVPLLTKPYDRAQLAKHLQLVMSNRT
jgi:CheY-like chemotaxis protein